MAWRYHGRAFTSQTAPEAYGICDRCGRQFNRSALRWQFDWTGPRLMNLRLMVCSSCNDKPFEHNRPIIVPPDPMPIRNPRPDPYRLAMPYMLADTSGREIDDTGGQFSYLTAPAGPGGSVDNSPTSWGPPNGRPAPLANAGMFDWIYDTRGMLLRDVVGAALASSQETSGQTGVTIASHMDGYQLRAPAGGPVLMIPD